MNRWQWWRRMVGGRWELWRYHGDTSVAFRWIRVDMFNPQARCGGGACVVDREDWRR